MSVEERFNLMIEKQEDISFLHWTLALANCHEESVKFSHNQTLLSSEVFVISKIPKIWPNIFLEIVPFQAEFCWSIHNFSLRNSQSISRIRSAKENHHQFIQPQRYGVNDNSLGCASLAMLDALVNSLRS